MAHTAAPHSSFYAWVALAIFDMSLPKARRLQLVYSFSHSCFANSDPCILMCSIFAGMLDKRIATQIPGVESTWQKDVFIKEVYRKKLSNY